LLAEEPSEPQSSEYTELNPHQAALRNYIASKPSLKATADSDANPIRWWLSIGKQFHTDLSEYACSILCTPASTASVERLFSVAGKCLKGDRNRLSPERLEQEVLVSCNMKLVKKYLDL